MLELCCLGWHMPILFWWCYLAAPSSLGCDFFLTAHSCVVSKLAVSFSIQNSQWNILTACLIATRYYFPGVSCGGLDTSNLNLFNVQLMNAEISFVPCNNFLTWFESGLWRWWKTADTKSAVCFASCLSLCKN